MVVNNKIKEKVIPYIFLLPGFLLFLGVGLYSLFFSLGLSFFNWSGVDFSTARFVGLKNFRDFLFGGSPLFSEVFYTGIMNNFKIAFFDILFIIPIALILAYLIQRSKGTGIFRTIYFIPMIAAGVAVYYTWQGLFAANGALNMILDYIGLDFLIVHEGLLGNINTSLFGVIITTIWAGIPGTLILYYAGLATIDETLYEAARIDGANSYHILTNIVWPLVKPITVIAMIRILNASFQMFENVFVLTGGGPANSSQVAGTVVYNTAFSTLAGRSGFGLASAVGWFVFLITLSLAMVNIKSFKVDF